MSVVLFVLSLSSFQSGVRFDGKVRRGLVEFASLSLKGRLFRFFRLVARRPCNTLDTPHSSLENAVFSRVKEDEGEREGLKDATRESFFFVKPAEVDREKE